MATPPNTPTPDFGTLGPGADVKLPPSSDTRGLGLKQLADSLTQQPTPSQPRILTPIAPAARLAVLAGAILAMIAIFAATRVSNHTRRAENEFRSSKATWQDNRSLSANAQKDAEQLLERAARNDSAATSQIEDRAASWRGRLQLTPKLTNLITAGFNSNDRQVRAATVQLDLAAMNVAEDSSSVDRLAAQAESKDHATRIWALWTLGLLANRGIATDRITGLLIAHLSDTDPDARRWAAEGLAYASSDAAIQPLLKAMHDDASPLVREAAARGLAQDGMFTSQQRTSAVPTLLVYANDPSLDAATRAWTFHALRDITAQNFPDDAAKWNEWYGRNR